MTISDLDKDERHESYGKALILLEAYLRGSEVRAFSLIADMGYVIQNSARIMRALFELCLNKNYSELTFASLKWCKLMDKKMLPTSHPF